MQIGKKKNPAPVIENSGATVGVGAEDERITYSRELENLQRKSIPPLLDPVAPESDSTNFTFLDFWPMLAQLSTVSRVLQREQIDWR